MLAESGIVTIVDTSALPATSLAKGLLADNAHSGTVDPSTHRLYVPIADADGHPDLRVLDTET